MEEMELSIRNIISSTAADDNSKGNLVYNKIIETFEQNNKVLIILNFQDIELVNTAFLNNAVGKLFDRNQCNVDLNNIRFKSMDQLTIDLLRETIMVANEKYIKSRP